MSTVAKTRPHRLALMKPRPHRLALVQWGLARAVNSMYRGGSAPRVLRSGTQTSRVEVETLQGVRLYLVVPGMRGRQD
jgi:hypothetical protein